jgi:HlyD family type I secretion membrane fusion protein
VSGQQLAVIRPTSKALTPPAGAGRTPATVADASRTIDEFQFDTMALVSQPAPLLARSTLLVMAALAITAILWATFAHIDRIITARGKIVSTAPNIVAQPLEAAIVRSVDVRVGDIVKAGTVLATLDPTFTEADLQQTEARVASLDAAIARLEAEQEGRPYAAPPNSLFDYGRLQEAIWREHKTQYEAQMRQYAERISRTIATTNSSVQERIHLIERLKILREVEDMRFRLEEKQTGSHLNLLLARDSRIDAERNLARADSTIIQGGHELEALNAERDVFQRQWESKIVEELVTKRGDREGQIDQLIKARKRQQLVRLETPVDAVVLEIAPHSVGSIVQASEAFIKLVPADAPLEVEAQIDARQLGYIAVGDLVQIKLDAYPYQEHGMAEGRVMVITSDSFTDSRAPTPDSASYYKTRIEMNKTELYNVPGTFRLIPGMPLTAEIKVGDRSVMAYFLRPITRGLNESMREP